MSSLSLLCLVFSLIFAGLPSSIARTSHTISATEVARTSAPASGPGRHALLIGISKYARNNQKTDWWDLHSDPDVEALHKVLIDKFQFQESDIKILRTKEETTHKSIVNAFRSFLIEQTKPGDIVYFHYSGHGGQVPDTNTPDNPIVGDELDGLDECLIPSDYISRTDGSNNIRDDEIGLLLDELKKKQPANVTLSFDSCFSGTITRGGKFLVRGQKWQGKLPPLPKQNTRGAEKGSGGLLKRGEAVANGYVVLTATRNNQVASETEDKQGQAMGLLSYSLANALSQAGPQTTYRDLFERLDEQMTQQSTDQNPQLEGDMDKVLMNGVAIPPQPYTPVVLDRDNLTLQAGELQGMTQGSRFALFSTDTKDFKTTPPLAEAEIIKTNLTNSILKLSDAAVAKGIKPQDLRTARAVEISHRFGDNRLKVYLQNPEAMARGKEITEKIRSLPLVNPEATASDWDVRLCAGQCPDQKPSDSANKAASPAFITIQRRDGSIIDAIPDGEDQLAQIKNSLEGEGRWRFLNELANKDPNSKIQVALRLVPVEVEGSGECDKDARVVQKIIRDKEVRRTDGGQIELSECDYVAIELMNTGSMDAYVTVLDLQNNGAINPIWPHPEVKVQENRIPADKQWHRLPLPFVFRIEKPYGKEIYKAIATSEPADFSRLLVSKYAKRGCGMGKACSPLELLLMNITLNQRSSLAGLNPADWATAVETFTVKPRQ